MTQGLFKYVKRWLSEHRAEYVDDGKCFAALSRAVGEAAWIRSSAPEDIREAYEAATTGETNERN